LMPSLVCPVKHTKNIVCGLRTDKVFVYFT
jgi:hypothetical protein